MYTRREDNSLEFSASIPVNACFWRGGDLGVIDYLFLLLFFSKKGGGSYIICCHLKLELLIKQNSCLMLLQDWMILCYQMIGRQSLGLRQKIDENEGFFLD